MTPRRYRSPKRDSAAARTHARIVAAAARQLRSARGTRELSLESVASVAGVSRLTVYNQFGSRRGLLEAVFDDRAQRGGLHRIPQAMAEPDPHVALGQIVAVFCEFWAFDARTLARIHAASVADPLLERSMRARNERRRDLLETLVQRMRAAEGRSELVDLLFVLTSHAVYVGLAVHRRGADDVCRILQQLVAQAVAASR